MKGVPSMTEWLISLMTTKNVLRETFWLTMQAKVLDKMLSLALLAVESLSREG